MLFVLFISNEPLSCGIGVYVKYNNRQLVKLSVKTDLYLKNTSKQ